MSIHPLSRPFVTSEVQITGVNCCGGYYGRPKGKDRVIARRQIIDSREVLVFFVTPHPRIDQTQATLQEMRTIVLELQNAYGLPKNRNLPNLPLHRSANVDDAEKLKAWVSGVVTATEHIQKQSQQNQGQRSPNRSQSPNEIGLRTFPQLHPLSPETQQAITLPTLHAKDPKKKMDRRSSVTYGGADSFEAVDRPVLGGDSNLNLIAWDKLTEKACRVGTLAGIPENETIEILDKMVSLRENTEKGAPLTLKAYQRITEWMTGVAAACNKTTNPDSLRSDLGEIGVLQTSDRSTEPF